MLLFKQLYLVSTSAVLSAICLPLAWAQADQKDSAECGPEIQKIGTIDIDTVETSPIVFKGELYRFESIREGYHGNDTDKPYFQFVNAKTGKATPAFAHGHALGSAYVEGDTVYAFGTPGWGASSINVFVSQDMQTWEQHRALDLPGWELFNTSVCKADGQYMMAFEVGGPAEVAGQRFTGRFASSKDLLEWELLPEPAVYTKEKYSACPTIRWSDGWYYVTYLNALGGYRFATHIVRSRDLATWENSPNNPVLMFDEHDKTIASENLTEKQIEEINEALNRNNSDLDFIEFEGKMILYYSWGDQVGNEFLAEAIFHGDQQAFFGYFFPSDTR